MLNQRSNQREWIDRGPAYYTSNQYRNCLHQLHRVGRLLGGERATLWAFDQLEAPPQSIVDVGCGGGFFTKQLALRFPQARVMGTDLSQEAIHFAQELHSASSLTNLTFCVPPSAQLSALAQSFDVITSTLVCHHLSDEELIAFLRQAVTLAKCAVILNDLHRHPLALAGFASIMPFLFPNRLVWHDGLLSIRRAFKRADWLMYLKAAEIPLQRCSISWHWAFRWILLIDTR